MLLCIKLSVGLLPTHYEHNKSNILVQSFPLLVIQKAKIINFQWKLAFLLRQLYSLLYRFLRFFFVGWVWLFIGCNGLMSLVDFINFDWRILSYKRDSFTSNIYLFEEQIDLFLQTPESMLSILISLKLDFSLN